MEARSVQDRQPTGWTYFAGCMLFIVGSLDALWGLAAILNNDIVVVGGHGAILADITTWGWVHLILGSIMALTGLGLFAGSSGARWAAIFFVMVNAITQIVWFPAAPLWAFLMILLDVTISLPARPRAGTLDASGRAVPHSLRAALSISSNRPSRTSPRSRRAASRSRPVSLSQALNVSCIARTPTIGPYGFTPRRRHQDERLALPATEAAV